MTAVAFDDVFKAYSDHEDSGGLFGVTTELPAGQFTTLLGPSGSGKTTLLRLIAGFLRPSRGRIDLAGTTVAGPKTWVPPNRRDLAMVFQSYALWPHMSVADNVAFGLRARKVPKSEIPGRVGDALHLVGLSGHSKRLPGELSGGQQQRVALARSLVLRPSLLLLDEPLSNLDADLRVQMRALLKDLQAETGISFLYVTHDQDEAFALSDYLLVLSKGHVVQEGTPESIYRAPSTVEVARFLSRGGLFLHGTVRNREHGASFVPVTADGRGNGQIALPVTGAHGVPDGRRAHLIVRSEDLDCVPTETPVSGELCRLSGTVHSVDFAGREYHIRVDLEAGGTVTLFHDAPGAAPGQAVNLVFRADSASVIEDSAEPGPAETAPSPPVAQSVA